MQTKRNFSAKREAIYQAISSTREHPSAERVYEILKPDIPDLSLGTVYRNLSVFKEMGLIKSVGVFNGQERFDWDMSQHSHFVCSECNRIIDIPKGRNMIDESIYHYVAGECGGVVESHSVTFFGVCRECHQKRHVGVREDA